MAPDRLEQGYIIVLPGIEGESVLNHNIVRGLLRANVPFGIEIHDWTYGLKGYFLNLRYRRRHLEQAEMIGDKIRKYRQNHPHQPVYLIGHSGGGAMTIFTLERLPQEIQITGGLLLVPALWGGYDLAPALARTERGLWNFCSWADAFLLGIGTLLLGTCDGHHCPSAGMTGFAKSVRDSCNRPGNDQPQLIEVPFQRAMLRYWNFGGHFGPVNPGFVEHWIAPIVLGEDVPQADGDPTPIMASAMEPSHTSESPPEAPQQAR